MTTTNVPSFWRQLSDIYDKWPTQLLTYLIGFVVATSFALFLELRLGIKPESVMLYTLGLIAVLIVGIPVLLVALHRVILNRTIPKQVSHLTANKHTGAPETLPRQR